MAEIIFKKIDLPKAKNILLSDGIEKLLQFRVEQEELSSWLYLSMSLWLSNNGFLGAAKLFKTYSDEERSHAQWAREYLLAMGVTPITPILAKQKDMFEGLPEIIVASYQHEIDITKQCKQLASQAVKEGDFMVFELAQRFLKEQQEEHDKMQNWVDRLNTFGTDKVALRFLDNEMGGN